MPETSSTAPALPPARKLLCVCYAAIALVALIATWSQNLAYSHGAADMFTSFWRETKATPASRSITVDLFLFALAAVILMVTEARKHRIRYVWLYVVGGVFIAISVTFPLFLLARELRLNTAPTPPVPAKDTALLVVFAALTLAATLWVDLA